MGETTTVVNTGRQVDFFDGAVVEEFCDSFQVVEPLEEKKFCAEKESNDGAVKFHDNFFIVDDGDDDGESPEIANPIRRPEPEVARDRAMELVALRLRRIGDELDDDIRKGSPMTSRRRRQRDTTGYPVAPSLFLDLFPAPRNGLVVVLIGDLARETLLRDLARVTVGDVMIAAGRALTSVLFELVSTVTCPAYFRSKWSFDGLVMDRSADHLDLPTDCSTATDTEINGF